MSSPHPRELRALAETRSTRSEDAAKRITEEARKLNAESTIKFVKADLTLLRNVDQACRELQAQEEKINLLFMTPGFLSTGGRDGTAPPRRRSFSLTWKKR